jgi:hypothetical protein
LPVHSGEGFVFDELVGGDLPECFGSGFDELVRHGEGNLQVGCGLDGQQLAQRLVGSVFESCFDDQWVGAWVQFDVDAGEREPGVAIGV